MSDTSILNLLTLDIPEAPPRELGFLDVVDHTTRETTICNVYRYFLDAELSPKISPLMVEALEELIGEKYGKKEVAKELDLTDYKVRLELGTGNGRIDIVLDSKATQSVVIIEAKVYHSLNNDLKDYWQRFDYPDHQKAGIVLSLESMSETQIDNSNFVSITHREWLNRVCSKGLPAGLTIKDYIYFNDFVNNMNHLTKSDEMTEEIKFYFQHSEKINKAIATKNSAYDFVIDQLTKVAGHFGWILHGTSANWRHLWDQDNKATVYYTVYPDSITREGGKVQVILEIYNRALPHETALRKLIPDSMQTESWGTAYVKHLASKTYHIPTVSYGKLADALIEKIKNDLEPTRQKMMTFLKGKGAETHQ